MTADSAFTQGNCREFLPSLKATVENYPPSLKAAVLSPPRGRCPHGEVNALAARGSPIRHAELQAVLVQAGTLAAAEKTLQLYVNLVHMRLRGMSIHHKVDVC